jgi:hypothetical protein
MITFRTEMNICSKNNKLKLNRRHEKYLDKKV